MDRRSFNRRVLMGGAAAATTATSLSLIAATDAAPADGPVRTAPAAW